MKYVVTGATGFVGKHLVPRLKAGGAELLLIGRDPDKLRNSFPDCETGTYADLPQRGQGYGALIHLAVLNNDQPHSPQEFEAVNVDLLLETVAMASTAGIPRFINISTVQAHVSKLAEHLVPVQ